MGWTKLNFINLQSSINWIRSGNILKIGKDTIKTIEELYDFKNQLLTNNAKAL